MVAFDWTNLGIAGAFVVGSVLGVAATIRLLRYLLDYLKAERDND